MNPLSWDVHRDLLPNHPNNNNYMENTSRTNNDWGTYTESPRHTNDNKQSSLGVHLGWQGPGLSSHNLNNNDSDDEDPDGAPLEMEEEDPELSRKRKELQQIEEQIIFKKAALALKTVGLLVNKTVPSDSYNDHSDTCNSYTLKDRVNEILKQRHPPSFLSKDRERMNSSSLSKERSLQDNHPLKLRVNALMKRRCSQPVLPTNQEVPDLTLPPASRRINSPASEENNINKGFQRFLSVLNKGVDMDLLSRIITDDSKDPPLGKEVLNIQPSVLENKSDLSSSCRSKSPVKNRQKKEEEQQKVDEQREHLKSNLKTRGSSLEMEEMNKLAHPSQERLNENKHGDTRADNRGDQGSQKRSSQRHYSISSSSSTSSRSTRSRGSSPSTPQHHCSHSRDSKQWFERSCTNGRSSDQLKGRDDNQDIAEAQKYRDKDDKVVPPHRRSNTSPANEENNINKGFQRFLSVLNKGVDMDFLSRIATDDSKDPPLGKELLNSQPSALENKSDPASMRKSQRSNSGSSLLGCSQANSVERKTYLPSEERSLNKRLSLHADEENRNDGENHCFGSSSKSKSPVKKKKKKELEEPKVDKQQEHLQNILKTLGLSLETEEINKMAHRTQERLYGKKHEDTKADSRGDQQQRSSQRHCSISSSSSASSRLTRSRSSSPSTLKHVPAHKCSNGESTDALKRRDDTQDSIEPQSYMDKDDKEISTYQHPYPQNQMYPQSQPAAFSEYPNYSLSQDSEYYNADLNSYWTYGTTPSSVNPLGTLHQFPGPVEQSDMVYPDYNTCGDPGLSMSEGQFGPRYGNLLVISTKQPTNNHCIKQLPNNYRNRLTLTAAMVKEKRRMKRKRQAMRKQQEKQAKLNAESLERAAVPQQLKVNNEKTKQKTAAAIPFLDLQNPPFN